jgi:hypothetical protein
MTAAGGNAATDATLHAQRVMHGWHPKTRYFKPKINPGQADAAGFFDAILAAK